MIKIFFLFIVLSLSCHGSRWIAPGPTLQSSSMRIRGGASIHSPNEKGGSYINDGGKRTEEGNQEDEDDTYDDEEVVDMNETINIIVQTSIGSSFLDKKIRVNSLTRGATVLDVQRAVKTKFPGKPPVELQRLFLGNRLLRTDEVMANITRLSTVPLTLDLLSGLGSYKGTLHVRQALEGFATIQAHQMHNAELLRTILTVSHDKVAQEFEIGSMESAKYSRLIDTFRENMDDEQLAEIAKALSDEQESAMDSPDTPWRNDQQVENSPLSVALAKEFDLNARSLKHFVYYSVLLVIFGVYGTATESAGSFLLYMIPVLWISKLRQLRLIGRIALNLFLLITNRVGIVRPLLPVTLQVIADHATDDNIRVKKIITPRRKRKY